MSYNDQYVPGIDSRPRTPRGARNYAPATGSKVALGFLAFFFPMIPVSIVRGCNGDVLINFLLWLFGYIPGVIHALYIISKYTRPNPTKIYNVYYVNHPTQIPQHPREEHVTTVHAAPQPPRAASAPLPSIPRQQQQVMPEPQPDYALMREHSTNPFLQQGPSDQARLPEYYGHESQGPQGHIFLPEHEDGQGFKGGPAYADKR